MCSNFSCALFKSSTALFGPAMRLEDATTWSVSTTVKLLYRMKPWFYDAAVVVFVCFWFLHNWCWLGLAWLALAWFSSTRFGSTRCTTAHRLNRNAAIEPAITWSLLWMKMKRKIFSFSFYNFFLFVYVCFFLSFVFIQFLQSAQQIQKTFMTNAYTIRRLFIYASTWKK